MQELKVEPTDNAGDLGSGDADFDLFRSQVEQTIAGNDYPLASSIEKRIPLYEGAQLHDMLAESTQAQDMMAEWGRVLATGPGVLVIKNAFQDLSIIDRATRIFKQIIEDEREASMGEGDHFAASGANDRIWNSLEKQCLADPENFARYYGNKALSMASRAWLGPNFQMTAQVNLVRPGGKAQKPHRDYHLGFMAPEQMVHYPAHIHDLSPVLTLQGAVAHCDMPIESGPTQLLPFSQLFRAGYLAFGEEPYQTYFKGNFVQLSLAKGDALFFNPALMHGAGENTSADIERMANLLQVSSAFGRAMESINRMQMCSRLYPVLADLLASGNFNEEQASLAVACTAEGYPFPTNLDRDPPLHGMAPQSQAGLMLDALANKWSVSEFNKALAEHTQKRES